MTATITYTLHQPLYDGQLVHINNEYSNRAMIRRIYIDCFPNRPQPRGAVDCEIIEDILMTTSRHFLFSFFLFEKNDTKHTIRSDSIHSMQNSYIFVNKKADYNTSFSSLAKEVFCAILATQFTLLFLFTKNEKMAPSSIG